MEETVIIKNSNYPIYVCVDNPLLNEYLGNELSNNKFAYEKISFAELTLKISELKKSLLILQTDEDEYHLIELSRRLKMFYGYETRIIFLSADYKTEEDASNVTDKFFQMPVAFKEIENSIQKFLTDTHKILVIDDSKLVHNHLVPPLANEGYKVLEAFNGKEGLDLTIEYKPDLIICDIEMPNMNGFEVCTEIRKHPDVKDTYIIMSSTLGSASDIQKGFNAGVDEYITKPVVIGELLERINRHFKQSLSGRENIIILEKDEHIIANITKSLRKQGFSVRSTSTIEETIHLIQKYPFDLIISEMELGAETAMDLCLSLKNANTGFHPTILILTSRDNNADYKMIMNMGVSGIISKPFSMDTLLASVERLLADRRTAAERKQLLKYLSKSSSKIASEKAILTNGSGGRRSEKKYASLLFTDIVNFTARCEKYPPDSVVEQINTIFELITKTIHKHEGDVDKFMGDACMAYWIGDEHASSAVKLIDAVQEIRDKIAEANLQSEILTKDPIRIRYGMNSGEIILCDIGSSEARIDLTVIGDHVNLAARLESASKQYGIESLLSEYTYALTSDSIEVREIDKIKVYGKNIPVVVYELLGKKGKLTDVQKELLEIYNLGKEAYVRGRFLEAKNCFVQANKLEEVYPGRPTNPSKVYAIRCDFLIKNPPKNWDGVWALRK